MPPLNLPPEVLETLFSYFLSNSNQASIVDLISCSLVSRTWYIEAIRLLGPSLARLELRDQQWKDVLTMEFYFQTSRFFGLSHCRLVKEVLLEISLFYGGDRDGFCRRKFEDAILRVLDAVSPCLSLCLIFRAEHISIDDAYDRLRRFDDGFFYRRLEPYTTITKCLRLDGRDDQLTHRRTEYPISQSVILFQIFPNLQALIVNVSPPNGEDFTRALQTLPSLHTLHFGPKCQTLGLVFFSSLPNDFIMSYLHTLHLAIVQDICIIGIAQSCPALQELRIGQWCAVISSVAVEHLGLLCPLLRILSVDTIQKQGFSVSFLRFLAKLTPSLQQLDLKKCIDDRGTQLNSAEIIWPNLTKIDFAGCIFLEARGFLAILEACRALVEVRLAAALDIDEDVTQQLLSRGFRRVDTGLFRL